MKKQNGIRWEGALSSVAVLLLAPALLSAQAVKKPQAKPQVVDMGSYRVTTPPGEGWNVEIDKENGRVDFAKVKKGSILGDLMNSAQARNTYVYVQPIRLPFWEWGMTEEEAAADILKTYALGEGEKLAGPKKQFEKGTTTLNEKNLHSLQFQRTVAISKQVETLEDCMVYLYFPPDFKKSRVAYEFTTIFTRFDSYLKLYKNPGLEPVHAVIDSLEIVDPLQAIPGPEGELLRAAAAGDVEAARQAIDKGAKADAAAPEMTALGAAALRGHRGIVELLLGQGADINRTDDAGGYAPLHQALIGGEPGIAEILVNRGADADPRTLKGFSALMYAAAIGHSALVSLLLERGADVNAKSNEGDTAFTIAAQFGSQEIAQLLLGKGADINAQRNDGWSALFYALAFGHADFARWLLESGADVNLKDGQGNTALMIPISTEDLEMARALIERGADVNAMRKEGGWTPLHVALVNEKFKIAKMFIEAGADVNAQLEYGTTPLIRAAASAPADIVKLLIEKGADVNAKTKSNQTALKIATKNKRGEIVGLLRAAGAKG
jgi:ankyrin repeat protein